MALITVREGLHILKADVPRKPLAELCKLFTYDNPAFDRVDRMGYFTGNIPRKIHNYEEDDATLILPRGATRKVQQVLQAHAVPHTWLDDRHEVEPAPYELGPDAETISFRPYQEEAFAAMLERENCLIRSPTGSGKTEIVAEFLRRLGRRAVVTVWTKPLIRQWVELLAKRYGWPTKRIGVLGGGRKRIGAEVTVATQQTLARLSDAELETWDVFVADEVQRFAARTFAAGVSRVPARWRIGVSADERRKDRLDPIIHDHFGKVAVDIPRSKLIAEGHICEVEVELIPTGFRFQEYEDATSAEKARLYDKARAALEADDDRTSLAARTIADCAKDGYVIGFADHIELVREVVRRVTCIFGTPCGMLTGDNPREFNDTLNRLNAKTIRAVVGTACVYQGASIDHLANGVVITPTATNPQLLEQQVGRLRRKDKANPGKRPVLRYLWDEYLFPSHLHLLQRYYGRRLVKVR